jgi:hypothetical protein
MTPTGPLTNVYYLAPPVTAEEPPARRPRRLSLRLRLLAFWWRLRLTAGELTSVLRRFGRPPVEPDLDYLEQRAELILRGPRPSAGPARIIDFAAARQRLRV